MRTWDGKLEITAFTELFEVDIQEYRYATSIASNHEYMYPNFYLSVRLYFLYWDYYSLLKNIEFKY